MCPKLNPSKLFSEKPMPRKAMLCLFASWILTSSLQAQEPLEQKASASGARSEGAVQFFETIDVNVVNVEVVVTDKKGNRIKGLTQDDFELREDGKLVKITNFYAVEDGVVKLRGGEFASKEAMLPEREAPTDALPEDQRLYLVIYIDNFNLKVFDRNRVFVSIREFLRTKLSPQDRVMLVTYDRELHVRRPFTSDPMVIASSLFEIEKMTAMGNSAERERQEVLREILDAEESSYAMIRARSYAESQFNDLTFSIDAIKQVVSWLAGVPGRKAVLYVASGLPLVAGEDVFHAIQDKWAAETNALMEARNYDASRRFQEVLAQANANRVTFYTIDAGGLRTPTSIAAENARPGATAFVDSVYFANIQGSLQMMAEKTGGRAIYNTNDPTRGLLEVAEDFRTYYSLGYSPVRASDGKYHRIEVRTRRKDLIVRHREGYRDKSVEARMADGVLSALHFDLESNVLGLAVQPVRTERRSDGNFLVFLDIRIPIGKVLLVPQGDHHLGQVRLFLAAMDPEGGVSEVQQVQVPIQVETARLEEAKGKFWVYSLQLLMRAGTQRLAVGARDDLAAITSFTVQTIQVGAG
jgi:VWFA-related protein